MPPEEIYEYLVIGIDGVYSVLLVGQFSLLFHVSAPDHFGAKRTVLDGG